MIKKFLLTSLAIASLGASGYAQTTLIGPNLNNGGFELPALATGGKVPNGFDAPGFDVPNWGNTGGTTNDVGFQNGPNGAGGSAQFAYFHGGETGAFNLSTYVIKAGDTFTLSWFGYQDTLRVQLIASTNGTFAGSTPLSAIDQVQGAAFTQYSVPTYTATATDVGKTIGIAVSVPVAGYANADNFTLTVTSVPEPSTYALMFAGLGGFFLLFRARRATI